MAFEFTDSNFQAEAMDTDKLVMVDFWAEWCGPCRQVGPIINELATIYDDVVIGKLNVDQNPEVAVQFKVRNIPTILLLKNGEIVEKIMGLRSKSDYEKAIAKHK